MIRIHKCTINDINELQSLSCRIFKETFETSCTAQDMQSFLEEAYNIEKLSGEMINPQSAFYFIYWEEQLAGYLKLNEFAAQSDVHDPQALEIERIYVAKEFQGKGLGKIFMQEAIKIATAKQKAFIWLGVWEYNKKALAFYKRHGFYQIGAHPFVMGDDHQTDLLMRKDLIRA